jgi:hypothetical protein
LKGEDKGDMNMLLTITELQKIIEKNEWVELEADTIIIKDVQANQFGWLTSGKPQMSTVEE